MLDKHCTTEASLVLSFGVTSLLVVVFCFFLFQFDFFFFIKESHDAQAGLKLTT